MTSYTWWRQWPAEALMGLSAGVLNFTAFALQRSMGGPTWTSPALVTLGQALWVLAPAWPPLLARLRRQQTFLWVGALSRGPLLLLALASVTPVAGGLPGAGTGSWALLLVTFLLATNLDAVYTPHRNALIRANYPLTQRGRIYGLVTLVTGACSMVASIAAGHLLDHDPTVVRWIFPAAAVLGVAGHVLLSRIRWRYDGPVLVQEGRGLALVRDALKGAWRSTKRTLREDRDFRDFEVGFFLYGMGLLSAVPLVVSRFAQDPAFAPSDWARADRLALPLTQILLVWLVGRLSDRIGIVRVGGLSFALLGTFFVAMCFVATPAHLLVAYVLFGVCMAGVNVAWALGPLHFAPPGQAHHYTSVHVAWVGVRSALAPALGWAVQAALSYEAALGLSAAFQGAAAWWTLRLARRVHPR
jgi:MFS family permease